MSLSIRVVWFADEVAYRAVFENEVNGREYVWPIYIPDNYVVHGSNPPKLIDTALDFLKTIGELNIEMASVKAERT
jgi:hypothetical protein